MKRLLPIALLTLAACSPNPPSEQSVDQTYDTANRVQEQQVADSVKSAGKVPEGFVCYAGAVGADSIWLRIHRTESTVAGELSYKPKEKDGSDGAISGTMRGDTLLADYTFESEGTVSVRQVAFLLKGNEALEGYGEMTEANSRQSFKSLRGLRFGEGYKAMKMECK